TGRAGLALQHRLEELLAARDGALRHQRHHLTALQRSNGLAHGRRAPALAFAIDPDLAQRPGQLTDHRGVEHLFLAEEPRRSAYRVATTSSKPSLSARGRTRASGVVVASTTGRPAFRCSSISGAA